MSITCPDCHAELEPQNGALRALSQRYSTGSALSGMPSATASIKSLRSGGLFLSERAWPYFEETRGI